MVIRKNVRCKILFLSFFFFFPFILSFFSFFLFLNIVWGVSWAKAEFWYLSSFNLLKVLVVLWIYLKSPVVEFCYCVERRIAFVLWERVSFSLNRVASVCPVELALQAWGSYSIFFVEAFRFPYYSCLVVYSIILRKYGGIFKAFLCCLLAFP